MRFYFHIPLVILSIFSFAQEKNASILKLENQYKLATIDTVKINILLDIVELKITGNLEEAQQIAEKGLLFINENKITSHKYKIKLLNQLGIIHRRKASYPNAIYYYLKAKEIAIKERDNLLIAKTYHNLGMVYRYQKEYDKSILNYKIAIELREEEGAYSKIASSYNMMGVSYRKMRNLDSAIICYQKAKTIYKKIKEERGIYRVNSNIATILEKKGEIKKALSIRLENLKYYQQQQNTHYMSTITYNIAHDYIKLNRNVIALKYLNISLKLATQNGYRNRIAKAFLRISQLEYKLGEYKSAYNSYKMYNRYSDSIYNIKNYKKINALELGYKFKQKKISDSLLFGQEKRRIQLLSDRESESKNLYFMLLCVTIGLSASIVYLIKRNFKYRSRLLKLEKKELLLEKEEIEIALSILKNSSNTEDRIEAKQELIKLKILTDDDWNYFRNKFELLYPDFLILLKEVEFKFTKSEERFLILKKLNIEIKEIAKITGVSNDSVLKTQYRLRKKISISKSVDIINFIEISKEFN